MLKLIRHYLFPHQGNTYRSKIIHNSSLLIIIVLLFFSSFFSILVNKTSPQTLGISYSISDQELLILVNEKRLENGLNPLKINEKLSSAANQKAKHMFSNNYWAHFAPDSTSPWSFILDSGYDYIYAGENLAKGFASSKDAVNAWMDSPTHRDNILSLQYEDVGFAVVEGRLEGEDTILIVELFGKEKNQFLVSNNPDINSALSTSEINTNINPDFIPDGSTQSSLLGSTNINSLGIVGSLQTSFYQSKPLIDIVSSAKTLSFLVTATLLIAFILDLIVITRKKIPRIVGDNLDHILLLSIFIVFIYIYNLGRIL